jgi:hypothetical protein
MSIHWMPHVRTHGGGDSRAIGRSGILDPTDPRLARRSKYGENGVIQRELTGVRADGTKFPIEASSVMFTDSMGRLRTSHHDSDISERPLEAERALKESEDFTRSTLNGCRRISPIVDVKGRSRGKQGLARVLRAQRLPPEKTSGGANYIDVMRKNAGDVEKTARFFWTVSVEYFGIVKEISNYSIPAIRRKRTMVHCANHAFPGEGPARRSSRTKT